MADAILVAFLEFRNIEPVRRLQEIERLGPGLTLEEGIDPGDFIGWWPCRYKGRKAGFEFALGPAADYEFDARELYVLGERTCIVSLTPRKDRLSAMVASIAAAGLCRQVGGVLLPAGELPEVEAADVGSWARGELADYDTAKEREHRTKALLKRLKSSEKALEHYLADACKGLIGQTPTQAPAVFTSLLIWFQGRQGRTGLQVRRWEYRDGQSRAPTGDEIDRLADEDSARRDGLRQWLGQDIDDREVVLVGGNGEAALNVGFAGGPSLTVPSGAECGMAVDGIHPGVREGRVFLKNP